MTSVFSISDRIDTDGVPGAVGAGQIELPAGLRLYREGDLGGVIRDLGAAAYTGPIGEILISIDGETEATLPAVGGGLLALLGARIGPKTTAVVGSGIAVVTHRPNMFIAVVGPTARARKGTAQDIATNVMRSLDPSFEAENLVGGFGSGESIVALVRDPEYDTDGKITYGRVDQRIVVLEPELSRVFKVAKREGSALSDMLRVGYDGNVPLQNRSVKSGQLKSSNHCVSLYGSTTPEELVAEYASLGADNGFGNRFMWIWSDSDLYLPEGGHPDRRRIDAAVDSIAKLSSASKIGRTAHAVEWWREEYPRLRRLGEEPRIGSLLSRAADHVIRVALIYAVVEGNNEIGEQQLAAGLAWQLYSEETVRAVLGGMVRDELAGKILNSIRSHSGVRSNRTDIHRALGRNFTSAQVGAAIKSLEGADLAYSWVGESDGGRPPQWIIATMAMGT